MKIYIIYLLLFSVITIACHKTEKNQSFHYCKLPECSWEKDSSFNVSPLASEYILVFENNPFRFDSTNILRFYLSSQKIFTGSFKQYINIKIPHEFIDSYSVPTLEIKDKNKVYEWGESKDFPTFLGDCSNDTHRLFKSRKIIKVIFLPEKPNPNNIIFVF